MCIYIYIYIHHRSYDIFIYHWHSRSAQLNHRGAACLIPPSRSANSSILEAGNCNFATDVIDDGCALWHCLVQYHVYPYTRHLDDLASQGCAEASMFLKVHTTSINQPGWTQTWSFICVTSFLIYTVVWSFICQVCFQWNLHGRRWFKFV